MNNYTIQDEKGVSVTLCDRFVPKFMTAIGIVQDSKNGISKGSSHEITGQIDKAYEEKSVKEHRFYTSNFLYDFVTSLDLLRKS